VNPGDHTARERDFKIIAIKEVANILIKGKKNRCSKTIHKWMRPPLAQS